LAGAPIRQRDYTLMLLNGTAPDGTTLLGWNTAEPNVGDAVVGIHYPEGSWERISFGQRIEDEDISVNGVIGPASRYYQVNFRQGIIEPGSSGSPLFNSAGEVVGTLGDGPPTSDAMPACSINPFIAAYSRFSADFAALKPYLENPAGSAVNAASYLVGAAPGMLLTVFGQNLSTGTQAASSVQLPVNMQGTTATVNGIPAPLLYVSPSEVNFQVPYETPAGSATVTVTSAGGVTTTSNVHVSSAMPGIFTDTSRRVVPSTTVRIGGYGTLFITGQGLVTPAVADGAAPPPPNQVPVSGLPVPQQQPVAVSIGQPPIRAQITFAGIPYFLVGVTQINFKVQQRTPTGDQPLVVSIGNTSSPAAHINVTQ